MARITNIPSDWSSPVTLSAKEIWQCQGGVVVLATQATTEPADDYDGVILEKGDALELASGEVVRYRTPSPAASIVRREIA